MRLDELCGNLLFAANLIYLIGLRRDRTTLVSLKIPEGGAFLTWRPLKRRRT